MKLVFDTLSDNLLTANHVLGSFPEQKILVSSAKSINLTLMMYYRIQISFIYSINNLGPSIDLSHSTFNKFES